MKKIFFSIIGLLFWPIIALGEGYAHCTQEMERYKKWKVFLWREIWAAIKFFALAIFGIGIAREGIFFILEGRTLWGGLLIVGYLVIGIIINF